MVDPKSKDQLRDLAEVLVELLGHIRGPFGPHPRLPEVDTAGRSACCSPETRTPSPSWPRGLSSSAAPSPPTQHRLGRRKGADRRPACDSPTSGPASKRTPTSNRRSPADSKRRAWGTPIPRPGQPVQSPTSRKNRRSRHAPRYQRLARWQGRCTVSFRVIYHEPICPDCGSFNMTATRSKPATAAEPR